MNNLEHEVYINMEEDYDLDLVFLENLYSLYGFEDDSNSMNLLYHYLYIRSGIFYQKKKISNDEMIQFIFKELNIDVFDNNFIFYDEIKYNAKQVGTSFLESLEFRANFEGKIDFKIIEDVVYVEGYKAAVKFRKSRYYKQRIQYCRLLELNKYFNIEPQPKYDVKFKRALTHNPYKRTLEEQLLSHIDSEKIMSNNTQYIDEKVLEDYLVNNLSLIEEGLVYQGRQIKVPGGIIDILAKDKNDNLVIIELKVEDDKSIIWQALHYPEVISKVHKVNKSNVRMLTVAPSYKESILMRLQDIDNVEIYRYNIIVSLGEIQELMINQINKQ